MTYLSLKMPDEIGVGLFQPSQADYEATRRRKALCLKNALTIVERFGQNQITIEMISQALPWLEREQFDDIPVERFGYGNCGYLLCQNLSSRQIQQTYRISLSKKKVYEVGDRKYFCSDWCYQASCYLRKQIPSEPAWSRSLPTGAPSKPFRLLSASAIGRPGWKKILDGLRDLSVQVDDNYNEHRSDSDESEEDDDDDDDDDDKEKDDDEEEEVIDSSSSSADEEDVNIFSTESVPVPKDILIVQRNVETLPKPPMLKDDTKSVTPLMEIKKKYESYDLARVVLSRLHDWMTTNAIAVLRLAHEAIVTKVKSQNESGLMSEYEAKVESFYNSGKKSRNVEIDETAVVMPLVDSISPKAYQLRLLVECLLPSLKAILHRLELPVVELCGRFQQVIGEFHLSNKNLHLKPREATLTSLALLHLLLSNHMEGPLFRKDTCEQLQQMASFLLSKPATEFYNEVEEIVTSLDRDDLNLPS